MNQDPRLSLSFVIPVLNGERFIGACLEHIQREMGPEDQIIVVDNGSTDRTLDIVRNSTGVETHVAPGVTIGALRNLGAAAAGHPVVAFIDADCLLCEGWRASVERVLSDPAVSATGSFYDLPPEATWVERAWWSFRPTHEHRTSFLISGNFVIRKAAFESVGGFDERLVTDEDTDVSRRLVSAGAVLVEAPSVRVIHLGNAKTLAQFFRKERWHATSILGTMQTHRVDRPMLLTFVFILSCLVAAATVPLWGMDFTSLASAAGLIMVAPVATAGYRVYRHGNHRFFFHLLPLYLIVYVVRSLVIFDVLLGRVRPR